VNWFKKLFQRASYQPLSTPLITDEMKDCGLVWRRFENGSLHAVCDFCGGNCGQCGLTARIGNVPFDFDRMIHNLHNQRKPKP
jgi:hypothetical protein